MCHYLYAEKQVVSVMDSLLLQSIKLLQSYNQNPSQNVLDDLREKLKDYVAGTDLLPKKPELTEMIKQNLLCIYASLDSIFKC